MTKTNNFGAKVKEGNNLEILKKGREYFLRYEDVYVVRYYCCTDNAVKDEKWVSKGDLKSCEICGKKLFQKKEGKSSHIEDGAKFKQKKHMIFVDRQGDEHHTCYGLEWCFGNIGFKQKENDIYEGEEELFSPPEFGEFLPLMDEEYSGLNKKIVESAKISYETVVEPFMKQWAFTDIDKTNVLQFMSSLERLKGFFNYFDEQAKRKVKQKLYDIIGVHYE